LKNIPPLFFTQESVPWLSYLAVAAVILFVVGFATGPGSIPWFFVTELFAQSGRPIATSIAVAVNWSANFLVGLGFSPIQVRLEQEYLLQGSISVPTHLI
jgi:SP family facilitated glucose transporter-like MFS transporter 1